MSNAYDSTRGNVTDRQRRKLYLLETYAADRVLVLDDRSYRPYDIARSAIPIYEGEGVTILDCCRCYRCGKLLTYDTVTVDRIKPGCKGGTYRRDNIRPSCSDCANKQGGQLRAESRNQVPVVRSRVSKLAARDAQAHGRTEGPVAVPDMPASGTGDLRGNGPVEG